jgi:hypothetical protein
MEGVSMAGFLVAIASLACLPVLVGAAPAKTKIFITSTSKTDTPKKANEAGTEAEAWARQMEIFTAEALAGASPCSQSMTPSDVQDLLGLERMRQLLGSGGDPATLAAIANSMDAQYLVHIAVTQSGGRSTVTTTVVDARTAKAVARDMRVIPVNSGAVEALEAFAKLTANKLAASLPQCASKDWQGTVTISRQEKSNGVKPGGGSWTSETSLEVTCNLQQRAGDAKCSVSYHSKLAGNEAETSGQASGSIVGYVTADVSAGRVSIHVSQLAVKGTAHNLIAGQSFNDEQTFSLGPWSVNAPSTGNEKSTSGSARDNQGNTFSWSFSRR